MMIDKVDKLIRDNKIGEAQQLLLKLRLDVIADRDCAMIARAARRAGLPKLMMPRLSQMIYETKSASTDDIIEYASTVAPLGLVNEAEKLLSAFPLNSQALLYRAFGHIRRWEYRESNDLLEKAIACKDLSKSNALIVKVNLVAGLIFEQNFTEAQKLLNSIIHDCENQNHQLYLNCLELTGQITWYSGNYSEALAHFKDLGKKIYDLKGYTSVMCRQWEILARAKLGELALASSECAELGQAFRTERQWEALRHYEWQLGQVFNSQNLLLRVYFGSPYPALKKIIKRHNNGKFENNRVRPFSAQNDTPIYDPLFESGANLEFGKLEHRLLLLMLSDQYQSWSTYRIFDSLYPDERFSPVSGPQKIYRLLGRLSSSLQNLPGIEIKSSSHGHRARIRKGSRVRVYEQMQFKDIFDLSSYVIETRIGSREFTSTELTELLHLHERTTARLIRELVKNKSLFQRFAGRSRYYSLNRIE